MGRFEKQFTVLPIPDSFIERVNTMGENWRKKTLLLCKQYAYTIEYFPNGMMEPDKPNNVNNLPSTTGVDKVYNTTDYRGEEIIMVK